VPPPHGHADKDQWIYLLHGTLRYSVDDVTRDLGTDSMFTPRGSVHAFSNPHGETAVALTILTPDMGPESFREAADLVAAGGPPDKAKLVAIMAPYGLRVAAPRP
jgi:quercetin dioxygenase-like cupin family protein